MKLVKMSRSGRPYKPLPAKFPPELTEERIRKMGRDLKQFQKNDEFLIAHKDQWRDEYPDQWVTVYQEELVSVGDTLQKALDRAEEQGVPINRVAMEYLRTRPITWKLAKMAV